MRMEDMNFGKLTLFWLNVTGVKMFDTSWNETGAFIEFCKNVQQCKNLINLIIADRASNFQPVKYLPELSGIFQKMLSIHISL